MNRGDKSYSSDDVKRAVKSLGDMLPIFSDRWKFKEIWHQIKTTQQIFNDAYFDRPQDREILWNRFQELVQRVRDKQDEINNKRQEQFEKSKYERDEILASARGIRPDNILEKAVLGVMTMGVSAVNDALTTRREELMDASARMKAAWSEFSDRKDRMIGSHKQEAWQALKDAQDFLNSLWEEYKEAQGHIRKEKQRKHQAWRTRTADNIEKNREKIRRLEGAKEKKQSNIARNEAKLADAWSESFIERHEGYIASDQSDIQDIEDKISQVEGWIAEAEAKLDGGY